MYQLQNPINNSAGQIYQLQDPINNSDGQRELVVKDVNGNTALKVLGKDHNVYNSTIGKLYTDNCKGPDYFGVAYNQNLNQLQILWVDTSDMLWLSSASEYKPLIQGIYSGGPINSVEIQTLETQDVMIQPTQPNNQNNGQNTYNGTNTLNNSGKISTGTFTYTYDRINYKYKLNYKGELQFVTNVSTTVISEDVVAFGFAGKYVVYLNDDQEMYAVELARLSKGTMILDDVDGIDFSSAGTNVIANVYADRETYSAEDIERMAKRELKNK
ncbi:MAG: hypothetical protein IKG42_02860 [Clostridia bacterium]|nr:hypothetical protein [Clostridia bacterium]